MDTAELDRMAELDGIAWLDRFLARRIRSHRVATPVLNKYRKERITEATAARAAGAIADAAARAERAAHFRMLDGQMDALIAASRDQRLLTVAEVE